MLDREAAIAAISSQFDPAGFDRGNAEMCLAGLREAGFVVVPAEATEAMWQAGRNADTNPGDSYSAVWRAMTESADAAAEAD